VLTDTVQGHIPVLLFVEIMTFMDIITSFCELKPNNGQILNQQCKSYYTLTISSRSGYDQFTCQLLLMLYCGLCTMTTKKNYITTDWNVKILGSSFNTIALYPFRTLNQWYNWDPFNLIADSIFTTTNGTVR